MDSSALPPSIQVRLAGVPIVLLNGQKQKTFRSRRALGLLAYLVCQRRPIPRVELVDLLWPDKEEDKGRGNLRWAASYLANLMPGCLERTRQSIQFVSNGGGHTVDIVLLGNALEEGNVELLADLLPRVQGEFMQGVYFDESAEFESWVVSQREQVRQQVSDAFVFIVGQLATAGQYERALSFAQQWVVFAPWEEQAYRWTMELLARLGRINAAIKQYEICREIMMAELGSEPSAALVALFERLQQTTGTSSMLLTQQKERFVGRASELTAVHQHRIHKEKPDRLIVFTGAEGCGKTRLAHAVVDEDPFLARQRLVSIDASGARSPEYLAEIVLEALIVAGQVHRSTRTRSILDYIELLLHNRDIILLLDDVPDVQKIAPTLQSWVYTAPRLMILVTSRQRCQVANGKVIPLKGLSQDGAVQLFTEMCERRPSGFQMQANDMPSVRAICRRLENNPRAILLASTLIDTMRCEEIAEQLMAWIDESSTPSTPTEQAAMLVWGTLGEDARGMLQQLALFDELFTLEGAEEITGIRWDVLKQIADQSLLRRVDEGWYAVPVALKQLIMTHYPPADPDKLYAAHAEYTAELVEAVQNEVVIAKMQPQIHATWQWFVDQKRDDWLRRMAIPYTKMLDDRARWRLGYEMFQYAVKQFQGSRQHKMIQPLLWYGHGLFAMRLREFERAKHNLLMAYKAIKGNKEPIAALFPFQLGIVSNIANDYQKARTWFEEAYQYGHTFNNRTISNHAMLYLLRLTAWMGDWAEIDQWEFDDENANDEMLTYYHLWLGYVAVARGAYEEAIVQLERVEQYGKGVESDELSGSVLQFQGICHIAQANWDDAKQCLDDALKFKREANVPQTYIYCELARLALLQGDPNAAQPIADRALSLARKSDDLIGRVYSLVILGDVQVELNRLDDAAGTLLHALVMSKSAGLNALSIHALCGLAKVAWYTGNYTLADRLIIGVAHSPYAHHQTIKQLPPPSANSPTTVPTIDALIDELLVVSG